MDDVDRIDIVYLVISVIEGAENRARADPECTENVAEFDVLSLKALTLSCMNCW